MVGLAIVLSLFTLNVVQSFYLEFAVIPLLYLTFRHGIKIGLIADLLYGILVIVLGQGQFLILVQIVLEYLLAPMALSVAGFFRKKIFLGTFIAVFFKYFFHFIAGILFWGQFAWKGWPVIPYSFVTNGVSALATATVASLLLSFLFKKLPVQYGRIDS